MPTDPIKQSPAMQKAGPKHFFRFLFEVHLLLFAIARIVHPTGFIAGLDSVLNVLGEDNILPFLHLWPLPFNALSAISNRETALHRDNDTRPEGLDMTMTCGIYHSCVLEKAGLGLRFHWPPGSISCFNGKLVRHGVSKSIGERVCLAYYMRNSVQERYDIDPPEWMEEIYG
jgi:hypothetical protein